MDELASETGTEDKKRKLLGDGPRVVDNDGKDGSTVLQTVEGFMLGPLVSKCGEKVGASSEDEKDGFLVVTMDVAL